MRLWKRRMDGSERRLGIVQELELLARRGRYLLLAVPVLVIFGFAVGHLLRGALSVREGDSARLTNGETLPRVHLASLSRQMQRVRVAGDTTAEYVRMYQDQVAPIEQVLRRRGVPVQTARRVAWPLVEQSNSNGVDPATVLSVLLIESAGRPQATSSVGARGLMQVMPSWTGYWGGCGGDLYEIEDNLCYGTKILAWYLNRHGGDERKALLGYNGCVRGTVTPNCRLYPEKVDRMRRQVRNELESARGNFPARPSVGTPTAGE